MTVSFFALYRQPADAAAFDESYFGQHVPLVLAVPGLVENRVHKVSRMLAGEPSYYLTAELVFESAESMKAALATPEWAAAGADLAEWGGLELVTMFSAAPAAMFPAAPA